MVSKTDDDLLAVVEDDGDPTQDLPDPYTFDFYRDGVKLEPEHYDLTRKVLAAGGSKHMVADMIGVSYRSFRRWVQWGEENLESDEELNRYGAFVRYYRAGLVEFEADQVSKVRNPEWLLERRMPERWGKKSQQEVTVSGPQYDTDTEISREDKEFLQNLAGGGVINESESETDGETGNPDE